MANLLHFIEIPRPDEDTSVVPIVTSQVTSGSSIVIKRSLSEIESMEVDEDGSHKKAKVFQVGGVLGEEISDDFKRVALVPTKSVKVNQFSFKDVDSSEPSSIFRSKEELKASYMEKRKQSLEETRSLLPKVRNLNNLKTSLVSARDTERNTFKLAMVSDKKVTEMELRLDKISVPDKIQLQKQTSDIIYSDLLQAMMRINKLQFLVDKLEIQLKHERVENKANTIHIKKLQEDIISSGNERDNTQDVRRMLEEKDNALQVLKKRLKIPGSEHVQSSELLAL